MPKFTDTQWAEFQRTVDELGRQNDELRARLAHVEAELQRERRRRKKNPKAELTVDDARHALTAIVEAGMRQHFGDELDAGEPWVPPPPAPPRLTDAQRLALRQINMAKARASNPRYSAEARERAAEEAQDLEDTFFGKGS